MMKFEKQGIQRYFVENNGDFPVKEEVVPDFVVTWDNYKNNPLEKRNKVLYFHILSRNMWFFIRLLPNS